MSNFCGGSNWCSIGLASASFLSLKAQPQELYLKCQGFEGLDSMMIQLFVQLMFEISFMTYIFIFLSHET